MLTASALRSVPSGQTVLRYDALLRQGFTASGIRAQVRARRWQRHGRALILHNGEPSGAERMQAAVIHHGPRALLTAFTAAEHYGLAGWHRDEIHVLVPRGARIRPLAGVVVHYTGAWDEVVRHPTRPVHALAPALVVAAAGFASPRPACGLLAAAVQQRLLRPVALQAALDRAPRVRHRALLAAAVADIAQGGQALSEIDFVRLCRRASLPVPMQQAVRRERSGRRRYLDAEWRCPDGRLVAAEVDGANHLAFQRWVGDNIRQNELVIDGVRVLRYPSIVVRTQPELVADQLRRALRG